MNCRDFENIASDLARGTSNDAAENAEGLAHAEHCRACRTILAVEQDLNRCLAAMAENDRPLQAAAAGELALRRIYRQNQVVAKQPAAWAVWDRPMKSRRAAWALAAVAALVIVATSIRPISRVYRNHNHNGAGGNPVNTATLNPPATAGQTSGRADDADRRVGTELIASTGNRAEQAGVPQSDGSARRHTTSRRRAQEGDMPDDLYDEELGADFLALTGEDELLPTDDWQIVRISLPKSALQQLGLPVRLEASNQVIQADVVVGEDGVAHSIRFVRQ